MVLIELDRLILKRRGQNPVRFASARLRAIGIKDTPGLEPCANWPPPGWSGSHSRGPGLAPWVTHLWYPAP